MRVLGLDLGRGGADGAPALVLLEPDGRIAHSAHPGTLAEIALAVVELAAGEPFLLGVDVPVVVPARGSRGRRVESLVRRRLGFRLPTGGRGAGAAHGVTGETLLAGLAAAGRPCLPWPDRERLQPGLVEVWPELSLKALLWEDSELARWTERADQAELLRSYPVPEYRGTRRTAWTSRLALLVQTVRALAGRSGIDLRPVLEALSRTDSEPALARAAALFDAALVAATTWRYLQAPETCLFLGDHESGYVVLPADALIRRLGADKRPEAARLFPQGSLRQRLGAQARLRPVELLDLPGRPHRMEATFVESPDYEFDNVDEMLWWKHARHVAGPTLPVDGLCDLFVAVGPEDEGLHLVRSRHRTLSFRFDPPAVWRARVPTRDGRTYRFRVLRATYETSASDAG